MKYLDIEKRLHIILGQPDVLCVNDIHIAKAFRLLKGHIWFPLYVPGCTVRSGKCQNSPVYFLKICYPIKFYSIEFQNNIGW